MSVRATTVAGGGAATVTGLLPHTGMETWLLGSMGLVVLLVGLGLYAVTART